MSGSLKVNVGAELNDSDFQAVARSIERQFNSMGQSVAKASKLKFEPVSIKSRKDLEDIEKRMKSLLTIQTELARRAKNTNQDHLGPLSYDYSKLYTNASTRTRKMQEVVQYLGGEFSGGKEANRPAWQQVGVGAAQAGLRATNGATGGVGGVAAGALGTGMSAGFGAGMMGLMGGILALGVGKIVGAAVEKIGQAEDNAVAYDKLKRTLGDVNVSFSGLKASLEGAASNVKITFDEAARLSMQFAKLGNLTNEQTGSLPGELQAGVGMSRSLGLDPAQGVGFLGAMRGMRQTQDEQGSRKMALLIGETIAKSNAFAKSDEVMEAISNYVTTQTRASHGANVGGYAGMFSAMVGSGIAGMDPAGAAGMLGKINSSLTAGGAKGEASQFFTAMVGQRMGLDPLQTQLLRESGAFATPDQVFGKGSIYERATGRVGPGGGQTFLGGTSDLLGQAYGGSDPQSIMLRAQATGNHLGISMTQAMAMGTLQPNQVGELQKSLERSGLKIGDVNMGGLSALSKVVSGSGADRLGVATELWSRTGKGALSKTEREQLDDVMKNGSEQAQKDLLTALVASRDQEMTQGKDIRDTKTAVENIKTLMADQLLPVTQAMRDGIMWMAGGKDGKSSQTIREDMAKADIGEKYQRKIDFEQSRFDHANQGLDSRGLTGRAYADKKEEERRIMVESTDNISALKKQRDSEIEAAFIDLRKEPDKPFQEGPRDIPKGWNSGAEGSSRYDDLFAKYGKQYNVDPRILKAIANKESSMNPFAIGKKNGNGTQDFGLMQHNSRYLSDRGLTDSWDNPERSIEEAAKLLRKNIDASGGDVRTGVRKYNGVGFAAESYAVDVMARAGRTPMPEDAVAAQRAADQQQLALHGSFDPLKIVHERPDGTQFAPPQFLNPRFNLPVFGRPN